MNSQEPYRGLWYAIGCQADQSPQLARLRACMGDACQGDAGDVYYYRTLAFLKTTNVAGNVTGLWADLATYVRWPGSGENMRDAFSECGLVDPLGRIWGWLAWNGKIEKRLKSQRMANADLYARKKASAKKKMNARDVRKSVPKKKRKK